MRRLALSLLVASPGAHGHVQDSAALLQRGVATGADPHSDLLGTLFSAGTGNFNCSRWPLMCEAPFNCQEFNALKMMSWYHDGVGVDGHSNPQVWGFLSPVDSEWQRAIEMARYSEYYTQCLLKKDPVGAAHNHHQKVDSGEFGHRTRQLEVDASLCFLEGLCVEERISSNSSMEEAEAVCDSRYGHERWTVFDTMKADSKDHTFSHMGSLAEIEGSSDGLRSRLQSTPFSLAACAKGYFHCDVVYCKEMYCNDIYYQEKYGHFLRKYKWIKSWQPIGR